MRKKKSKQDRIIDLLGAICEKLDKLLEQGRASIPFVPYTPPEKIAPYPTVTVYGMPRPMGTGDYDKTWTGTGDVKP